ncbi:MAG TPA: IS4 family transposase [Chloroflexota bacterium]|nr:IS4 family transposase [Chloroflexota bacterium]
MHTLAALINGIVGSGRTSLPAIASHLPDGKQRESRIKRFERFLKNERLCQETFFMPFASALLARLPAGPLVLVMDASEVGRGCLALVHASMNVVVSLVFHKRALPLAWIVVKGNKGHLADQTHRHLLEKLSPLIGPHRTVIFLGDGEFDGCGLLAAVRERGWRFVCRTAKNVQLEEAGFEGCSFSFADLCVCLGPGQCIEVPDTFFTMQGWGPVLALAVWEKGYKEPLFLVSNLELAQEALFWYKKRFLIETLFSDQKSRGFFLHKSHFSDPSRLARLLIATCLAYLWLVLLGAQVMGNPVWRGKVHRCHRCDLSLFSLGRAWLQECLNEGWRVPVAFSLSKL